MTRYILAILATFVLVPLWLAWLAAGCVYNDSSANVYLDVPATTDAAKLASIAVNIYQCDNATTAAKPVGIDAANGNALAYGATGAMAGGAVAGLPGAAAGGAAGLAAEKLLRSPPPTAVAPVADSADIARQEKKPEDGASATP